MPKKKSSNRFINALILPVSLASFTLISGMSPVNVLSQCITTLSQYRPFCSKAVSEADGKKHITVNLAGSFQGTPPGDVSAAMQAALDQWNARSDTSGVVFEMAQPGTIPDIEFTYTTDESSNGGTGGCAAYNSGSDRIMWGPSILNRQASLGAGQTAAVFMHELGHYLGLDHTVGSPSTIMTQGDNCQSVVVTPFVSEADAQKVADCAASNCRQLIVPGGGGGGGGGWYETPPCEDHWSPWGIYDVEGDLIGFEWEYSGCF